MVGVHYCREPRAQKRLMRRLLRSLIFQFRSLFGYNHKQADLDEEVQFHIDMVIKERVGQGISPKIARKEALKEFGGVEQTKEDCRNIWTTSVFIDLLRDIRFGVYSLRKSPGFSLAVIITLALCIGLNTTILSTLYSLILKPLPFENSERLVQVFNIGRNAPLGSGRSASGWTQYLDFKKRTDLFEGLALRQPLTKIISRNSIARRVRGQSVSADFFDLMRVKPLLGRFFSTEEIDPGPGHVIVLTESTWENEYNADPSVIGQQIRVDNNLLYTIIGVAPRSVEMFDYGAKFFIPFKVNAHPQLNPTITRYGDGADLWVRLKKGISHEVYLEQLQAIERHWYEGVASVAGRQHYEAVFERIELDSENPLKHSLILLQGGAVLVLLVGCLNITNLLLSRAGQKHHELSIRNALGAGKFALRKLMVIESFLLTAVAMGGGIILAWAGLNIINGYLAALAPAATPIVLDKSVLASIIAILGGLALLMGILPIESLWKAGLFQKISGSNNRTSSEGSFTRKLSNTLVIIQVAVAFALLIGAGLLFNSFNNVLAVDPGFEATRIVKGRVEPWEFYQQKTDTASLMHRITVAMKEIPSVQNVGFSLFESFLPYSPDNIRDFVIRGTPKEPSQQMLIHFVSPEYLTTMGIPILKGRDFNQKDSHSKSHIPSFIVDEIFAHRFFKDGNAVGAEISQGNNPPLSETAWSRIIGVTGRANLQGLEQRDGLPVVYACMSLDEGPWSVFTILLRTSRSTVDITKNMRTKLREIDPRLPLIDAETLQDSINDLLLNRKAITLLLSSFAGLTLLLALVGIYGVLAYDVLQRRREIGIRIALGASKQQVLMLILREGLLKTMIGLGLGIIGAFSISHYLNNLLFDITPFDLLTYVRVSSILFIVALTASYLPARRAANLDPLKTLTAE